jgi:hypothetical protein
MPNATTAKTIVRTKSSPLPAPAIWLFRPRPLLFRACGAPTMARW